MALIRLNINMAFKLPLDPTLKSKIDEAKIALKWLKSKAVKPSPTEPIVLKQHTCYHDEGKDCPPEVDI